MVCVCVFVLWEEVGAKEKKWREVAEGGTTTGGQEKSTAGRRHNKEWAAWWLVLGLMFCRMQLGAVGGGWWSPGRGADGLFPVEEMGLAKGMGSLDGVL